jgi:hypothetical protein
MTTLPPETKIYAVHEIDSSVGFVTNSTPQIKPQQSLTTESESESRAKVSRAACVCVCGTQQCANQLAHHARMHVGGQSLQPSRSPAATYVILHRRVGARPRFA